jgi:hypothetical protein
MALPKRGSNHSNSNELNPDDRNAGMPMPMPMPEPVDDQSLRPADPVSQPHPQYQAPQTPDPSPYLDYDDEDEDDFDPLAFSGQNNQQNDNDFDEVLSPEDIQQRVDNQQQMQVPLTTPAQTSQYQESYQASEEPLYDPRTMRNQKQEYDNPVNPRPQMPDNQDVQGERMVQRIQEAEDRAVNHAQQRAAEDSRDVRRSHKSSLSETVSLKDAEKKAKMYRIGALVVVVIILILAVYQTVIPKKTLSESDVQTIAAQTYNDTGFPLQSGSGLVQQFMTAYLQADGSSSASQMIDTFYNGMSFADASKTEKGGNTSNYPNITVPSDIQQKIEYGPYVYEAKALASNGTTATYRVGALVYHLDNNGQPIQNTDTNTTQYDWVFYQVDLSYNAKTEKYTVFQNSPTRVAPPTMSQATSGDDNYLLPGDKTEAKSLENSAVDDLVKQFMQAWAASDSSALSPLTSKQSTADTKTGLHGTVTLNGNPEYKVYGHPSDDNYYRVLVTVQWNQKVTDQSNIVQKSTYVLKMSKDGENLSIIDIQPYPWYPQQKSDD